MMHVLVMALALALGACRGLAGQETPPSVETGFFHNAAVRLSYRFDRPARSAPVPAVVIGHGSGRTEKDSCQPLAMRLLERGFATLCYDKRGVGQSTGRFISVGTDDSPWVFPELAGDMAAAVRFLRAQNGIDHTRIGLVGASQAGWIIPLAAAQVRPAFMILLVGPTVSVGEEMFYSRLVENSAMPLEDAYQQLPAFTGPHGFDPRPVLESLTVPGLWLLGAEDRSIPTPKTVAILDTLTARGRPFERVVFPGSGHDLRGAAIWDEIDRWLAATLR